MVLFFFSICVLIVKVATSWSKKYFKELNKWKNFPGVKHTKNSRRKYRWVGKDFSSLQKQYVNPALIIKRFRKIYNVFVNENQLVEQYEFYPICERKCNIQ